jgi:predicted MPP superfamily phosphohydrolase
MFFDDRPVLGAHKTIRGFVGGLVTGCVFGYCFGFSMFFGLLSGLLSMLGDILSSFIKRRIGLIEGAQVSVLDLSFEGLFPLMLFHWVYDFSWTLTIACLLLFIFIAYGTQFFLRKTASRFMKSPVHTVRSRSGIRQWRACHTALSPVARYLNFENFLYYHFVMKTIFKCVGLYHKGVKNALDIILKEIDIMLTGLPESFESFRILFISDLHIDGNRDLIKHLIQVVDNVEVDVCLVGGDFRMEMYGPFTGVAKKIKRLTKHIHSEEGIFGVLGNHDCLEVAPDLEDAGIYMLINEGYPLERNGEKLWIAGVDDPHYYRCNDLKKACKDIPEDNFILLLAHSPEIIREIDKFPVALCLCGHTHGGQIKLPLLGPVFTHCRVPRRFNEGLWNQDSTIGYTTTGVGSSGLPVRFNCPPEVVVFTLRKGNSERP